MNPDNFARIAESQIIEAIEEGKFDNLPGKGQPIVFDDDASTPIHIRMANKVLKNAGIVPDWVQCRKDIVEERQAAAKLLAQLQAENARRLERLESTPNNSRHHYLAAYTEWRQKSRDRYLASLKSVNTAILKFCINAPASAYNASAFTSYRIDEEMKRFDELVPTV